MKDCFLSLSIPPAPSPLQTAKVCFVSRLHLHISYLLLGVLFSAFNFEFLLPVFSLFSGIVLLI